MNSRKLLSWLLFAVFVVLLFKSPGLRMTLLVIFGIVLLLPTLIGLFAPTILKSVGKRMGSSGFGGFNGGFNQSSTSQQAPPRPAPTNTGKVTITRVAPDPKAKPADKKRSASEIEDVQFEEL